MGSLSLSTDWLGPISKDSRLDELAAEPLGSDKCPTCNKKMSPTDKILGCKFCAERDAAMDNWDRKHDQLAKADDYEDAPVCPVCGGDGNHLGTLGNREHFRCRNCGMDFSFEKPKDDVEKADRSPDEQRQYETYADTLSGNYNTALAELDRARTALERAMNDPERTTHHDPYIDKLTDNYDKAQAQVDKTGGALQRASEGENWPVDKDASVHRNNCRNAEFFDGEPHTSEQCRAMTARTSGYPEDRWQAADRVAREHGYPNAATERRDLDMMDRVKKADDRDAPWNGNGDEVGEHNGVKMFSLNGSYSAPSLGLYGYPNDIQLTRAMDRKQKGSVAKAFDDSESRDETGKWTSGGSSGNGHTHTAPPKYVEHHLDDMHGFAPGSSMHDAHDLHADLHTTARTNPMSGYTGDKTVVPAGPRPHDHPEGYAPDAQHMRAEHGGLPATFGGTRGGPDGGIGTAHAFAHRDMGRNAPIDNNPEGFDATRQPPRRPLLAPAKTLEPAARRGQDTGFAVDARHGLAGPSPAASTPSGHRPIYAIAEDIARAWKKQPGGVNYAAKPYLEAMSDLNDAKDNYGADSAKSVLAYFLANSGSFKGPEAKALKTEVKQVLAKSAIVHHSFSKNWFDKDETCPRCDGKGYCSKKEGDDRDERVCSRCGGTKRVGENSGD